MAKYIDHYDYDVECCECGKEIKYCDSYYTMEPDTGYHWYYCRDCYGTELAITEEEAPLSVTYYPEHDITVVIGQERPYSGWAGPPPEKK